MVVEFRNIRHVILDIDGTICPITFTKNILFPYALKSLSSILQTHWSGPEFQPYRSAFPESAQASPEAFEAHVKELTEQNAKVGYLKDLQGYLWEEGYKTSAYTSPFFPDVRPALARWRSSNISISIYSAGSVFAQKLLFEYVNANDAESSKATVDLRYAVSQWFDTSNAGPKVESQSYLNILKALNEEAGRVLFFSDNEAELRAAKEVGMKVLLVDRPGNPDLGEEVRSAYSVVESFVKVEFPAEKDNVEGTAKRDGYDEQTQPVRKKLKTSRSRVKRELSAPRRRSQRTQDSRS